MRFASGLTAVLFSILFSSAWAASTVCVRVSEAQLKSSPEKNGVEVGKVPKYTPFKLPGKKQGSWIQVEDMEGHQSWIRRSEVSTSMKCLKVIVDRTRMHRGPGKSFPVGDLVERGDSFLDLGGEDGWTQVQNSKGEKSWINMDHTWKPYSRLRMSFENEK